MLPSICSIDIKIMKGVYGLPKMKMIDTLQSHPWITDESDEEAISEGEDSDNAIDEGFITSWRASIIDSI